MCGPRGGDLAHPGAAFLAISFLVAVGAEAGAAARRLPAGRADQQHVGNLDRHLFAQAAPLRVALAALHVLVDAVDAFDHELAGRTVHLEDLGPRAPIVADLYFHGVVDSYVHQTTSLARLTIFMKLRSRS